MKANELRVGNLVYNRHNEVDFITETSFFKFTLSYDGANEEFKSIPLTGEWILKAGFKHIHDDWYYNCILSINISKKTAHIGNYCINNVEFVHQLQNIYFALAGEELIINN